MKALIADAHFGYAKGSQLYFESMMKFFTEQFIPELRELHVTDVYILGDLFHVRESINAKIVVSVYNLIANDMRDFNIHILAGNHDIYHSNSGAINTVTLFRDIPNVQVYSDSHVINNGQVSIVPWVINEDEFIHELGNIDHFKVCLGHFEFSDFAMNYASIAKSGMNPSVVTPHFKKVYTGHYHIPSSKVVDGCEIRYIGSVCQLDNGDCGSIRGYTLVDDNFEFIRLVENRISAKFTKLKFPDVFIAEDICGNFVTINVDSNDVSTPAGHKDWVEYLKLIDSYFPISKPNIVYGNSSVIDAGVVSEIDNTTTDGMIIEYIATLDDFTYKVEVINLLMRVYSEVSGVNVIL